jgi:protein tyrosine/serine phosphatase
MVKHPRRVVTFVAVLVLAAAAVVAGLMLHNYPVRDFGVVQDGVLYRCGQPEPDEFQRLLDRYHIRTVVSFREIDADEAWFMAEQDWCRKRGVRLVEAPIGNDDPITGLKAFLAVATDPASQPVLVHCEHGRIRTGLAVAAYRIAVQHWSYGDALAEARKFRFDPLGKHSRNYDAILRLLAAGTDWQSLQAPPPQSVSSAAPAPSPRG